MSDLPPLPEVASEEATPPPQPSFNFQSRMLAGYVLQLLAIVFYSSVLIVVANIRATNKRSAPFYTIFFCIGVCDIIHALAIMWMLFESDALNGEILSHVTYVCSYLTCFCYLININGNGLMAYNRLAATYQTYPKIFSSFLTRLYLILLVSLAFIASIPALFRRRVYIFVEGVWVYFLEPEWLIKFQRQVIIGHMIVYIVLSIIFTLWAHYRIRNFIHMSRYHESDKTLLYFNAIHIAFHSAILVFEVYEILMPGNAFMAFVHRNIFFFLFSSVVMNSFTLTCTTVRVRQGLSKLWCRIVKLSTAKVSMSQHTALTVFNVSERY